MTLQSSYVNLNNLLTTKSFTSIHKFLKKLLWFIESSLLYEQFHSHPLFLFTDLETLDQKEYSLDATIKYIMQDNGDSINLNKERKRPLRRNRDLYAVQDMCKDAIGE